MTTAGGANMELENNDLEMVISISEQVSDRIRQVFNSNIIGVYLIGSVVLNDWHYGKSDIDLTIVVKNAPSKETVPLLERQIKPVESKYAKMKLEIQYIPISMLEKSQEDIESILVYHDKKHRMSYFSGNPVTWYVLEKYGIVIWGKPVDEFDLKTTKEKLCSYVYKNVKIYWKTWAASAAKIFSNRGLISFTDWAVEWCVCGLSRMVYTLQYRKKTLLQRLRQWNI